MASKVKMTKNGKLMYQNYLNFNRSSAPERLLCYEDGSWVDLKGGVFELVRSSFVERKAIVVIFDGGSMWMIDFCRMLMINLDSEDQKPVAWIDVDGNCFFPIMTNIVVFVDGAKVRVPQIYEQDSVYCECGYKNHVKLMFQNYLNFNRSAVPERFMCYEDGSWIDMKGDAFEVVRSSFVKRKVMVEVLDGGSRWLIDFHRMLMFHFDSEYQKSVAWIDVNGNCFFPVMADRVDRLGDSGEKLCSDSETTKVAIEMNIVDNLNKRSRKKVESELDGEGTLNDQPRESKNKEVVLFDSPESKKRKLFLSDCKSPRWSNVKLLKEEDIVYQNVKKLFLSGSGLGDAMIKGIHSYMKTGSSDNRYEVFRKQFEMTKKIRGGKANLTLAWHGTSAKEVETIFNDGFRMPSKVPDSEARGIGIYLSPKRSPHIGTMLTKVDHNGERHAILCRVILGNCEKVEAHSQQSNPSSVNFDTGVDDLVHPKWYIVWCANMKTHILPEFVVSYKLSNEVPGRLDLSPFQNGSDPLTAMYLSRLRRLENSLPAAKARELRTLNGEYMNGKIPEEIFMKQLESLVGGEMLLLVACEVLQTRLV